MRCKRCKQMFTQEEADRVADSFNLDDLVLCFPCAEEVWKEREQDASMSDVCQDEGDGP